MSLPERNKESGATVVEYALMVAFVAMAVVVTVALLGEKLDESYEETLECVKAQTPAEVEAACN